MNPSGIFMLAVQIIVWNVYHQTFKITVRLYSTGVRYCRYNKLMWGVSIVCVSIYVVGLGSVVAGLWL